MIYRHQLDPTIPLPLPNTLIARVSVVIQRIRGHLVFKVTRGFPDVAQYLLPGKSPALLMKRVTQQGGVQDIDCNAFYPTNCQELGRIFRDPNSTIAIFHPSVNSLDREVVQGIPFYGTTAAGQANNKAYKMANMPAFYIDNIRLKSVRAVLRIVGGARNTTTEARLQGMTRRFVEQGADRPVEAILNGTMVTYKLADM